MRLKTTGKKSDDFQEEKELRKSRPVKGESTRLSENPNKKKEEMKGRGVKQGILKQFFREQWGVYIGGKKKRKKVLQEEELSENRLGANKQARRHPRKIRTYGKHG